MYIVVWIEFNKKFRIYPSFVNEGLYDFNIFCRKLITYFNLLIKIQKKHAFIEYKTDHENLFIKSLIKLKSQKTIPYYPFTFIKILIAAKLSITHYDRKNIFRAKKIK
ncbi:hypothetical protein EDEG_00516 [Edhazardia aedis USNM 41457]|uniref:Uncharacterized protein n=1 Tax=Edhazardia aedis (strain USNM 41457) TaxID=1003232 RepID=J9D141_EDHAE|nr:hypothetical protein EDEG_00516 [Edhazardia aedis USNM 41457]|eukprot:EJW01299.1 hypothetical protein EDEG_00516 [Edhazardia aedis USNM 41457]